jgi:single-stranded-DNA-specific exonuclease
MAGDDTFLANPYNFFCVAGNARAQNNNAPDLEPTKLFDNVFAVESWRAVGGKHLRMQLRPEGGGDVVEAILFDAVEAMPPLARVRALYQLDLNDWNGRERLQLLVRHIESP